MAPLASLLLLAACRHPVAEPTTPASCASVTTDLPTVVRVTWTTDEPGVSHVEWDGRSTPVTGEPSTEHAVTVLGLKPNQAYDFVGVTETDAGSVRTETCTVDVAPAPADLPEFTLTVPADERANADGYVLTSTIGSGASWVVVLDRDADPVWWAAGDSDVAIPTAEPGLDGASITWTHAARDQAEDAGGIVRVSIDGATRTSTRAPLAHHDYAELPDGRFAYLRLDFDDPDAPTVALDDIAIVDEGAVEGVEPEIAWSYEEDWRGVEAACRARTPDAYGTGAADCTHANSLLYDADTDRYHLMSKNLDHLLQIDAASGTFDWELGGETSTFTLAEGWSWSRVHMSDLRDGAMCVFDNGYDYEPAASRVTEVTFDEAAGTAAITWSWSPDPGEFVGLLGDCWKTPAGTWLTAWTNTGTLREVEAGGDVVWQAEIALGNGVGRARYLSDLYTLDR